MFSLKAFSLRTASLHSRLTAFTSGCYCSSREYKDHSSCWGPQIKWSTTLNPGFHCTAKLKLAPVSRRFFSTQTMKIKHDIGGSLMSKPLLVGSCGGLRKHRPNPLRLYQIRFWSSSDASDDQAIYKEVADMIKNDASNIMVMCGAGISTPSGIPDFRSPGTGLYHNLQKYNLPYPEAIFDIHYFMMDPRPFFTLAQDLYPGINYKPNIVHYFMRLLLEKKKIQKVYTQNIDGLERMAGIPEEKLMEAHGTFSRASCTLCGKIHPSEKVKEAIITGEIPMCEGSKCKGKVKPDIVFFGENLPEDFWNYHQETHFTDLLLVIGTSLEVYPFAGIAEAVGRSTPRILINRDIVGSFGTRHNDFMLLGDLEDTIRRLAETLEWVAELENLQQGS